MGVLNVKAAFPATARLSPPLSCRIKPVPTRPVTVPPIVKGPPPEPEPEPEPALFGTPAQALIKMEIAIRFMRKKGLRAAFINVLSPWGSSPLKAPIEFEARSPYPIAQEWIVRVARTGFTTI